MGIAARSGARLARLTFAVLGAALLLASCGSTADPVQTGTASLGAIHIYTREVANHRVTVVGEAPAASVQRIGNAVEYHRPQ